MIMQEKTKFWWNERDGIHLIWSYKPQIRDHLTLCPTLFTRLAACNVLLGRTEGWREDYKQGLLSTPLEACASTDPVVLKAPSPNTESTRVANWPLLPLLNSFSSVQGTVFCVMLKHVPLFAWNYPCVNSWTWFPPWRCHGCQTITPGHSQYIPSLLSSPVSVML